MHRFTGLVVVALVVVVACLLGCGGGSSVGTDAPAVGVAARAEVSPAAVTVWTQPATGPGSAVYAHASYATYKSGSTATDYTIYTPTSPVPTTAPVVIFNHGWSALTPSYYEAWIIHLVRKGNIVIFPQWQSFATDLRGSTFLPNATTAVRNALTRLDTRGPVKPDRTKVACFGHSIGGVLSADMGATFAAAWLPQPKAIFSVEPGTIARASGMTVLSDVTISDYSKIPSSVLLVTLNGEVDLLVGDTLAKRIYQESTAVRAANKNRLTVRSDNHGTPALVANHLFPMAAKSKADVDGLDYYALWKIGDALLDAAFRGTNRQYALGNTAQQRYMGKWVDNVAVKEMTVQ